MIPKEQLERMEKEAEALITPDEPNGYYLRNAYLAGAKAEYLRAKSILQEKDKEIERRGVDIVNDRYEIIGLYKRLNKVINPPSRQE